MWITFFWWIDFNTIPLHLTKKILKFIKMKKMMMVAILLIASIMTQAQDLKVVSSIGIGGTILKDPEAKWYPVFLNAVEYKERIGFEFGYSWKLNSANSKEFNDYVNGISNTFEGGRVNRTYSIYYKTKRVETTQANIGLGVNHSFVAKAFNLDAVVENTYQPFVRIGVDSQLSKRVGMAINMSLGQWVMLSYGLTVGIY